MGTLGCPAEFNPTLSDATSDGTTSSSSSPSSPPATESSSETGSNATTESAASSSGESETSTLGPTQTSDAASTSSGFCGDGELDPATEECDGVLPGGMDCLDFGFKLGDAFCTPECVIELSYCHTCGDGLITGPESCDGENLAGNDCNVAGFHDGVLACNSTCSGFDESGCTNCGNGMVDPGEDCEADDIPQQCSDLPGLTAGALACNDDCTYDTSGCTGCGNGVIEIGEECDGEVFSGTADSCTDLGFEAGELACVRGTCLIDSSGCSTCGNGVIEADEICDLGEVPSPPLLCSEVAIPSSPTGESLEGAIFTCAEGCELSLESCLNMPYGRCDFPMDCPANDVGATAELCFDAVGSGSVCTFECTLTADCPQPVAPGPALDGLQPWPSTAICDQGRCVIPCAEDDGCYPGQQCVADECLWQ